MDNPLHTAFIHEGGSSMFPSSMFNRSDLAILRQDSQQVLHDTGATLLEDAVAALMRYEDSGGSTPKDLELAERLYLEASITFPADHPSICRVFLGLARCRSGKYWKNRDMNELNEAITLSKKAHNYCQDGHSHWETALSWLSDYLTDRFAEEHNVQDINEAISLLRECLTLHPMGDPDRQNILLQLATRLRAGFDVDGDVSKWDEAIDRYREAITITFVDNRLHARTLLEISICFWDRYEMSQYVDHLKEVIAAQKQALGMPVLEA